MDTLYKKIFAILMAGCLMGTMGAAIAGHPGDSGRDDGGESSEDDPYCMRERNGASKDYDGIGWGRPPVTQDDIEVEGMTLFACEGEHWDGEDSVQPDKNNDGSCSGPPDLDPDEDAYNVAVFQCNEPGRHDPINLGEPVGVRASGQGDKGARHGALYVALRISGLGNIHVFAGGCQKVTNDDSEQLGNYGREDNSCQGEYGHGAAGVYLQDNAPQNALASVVSALRLTKGYVAEDDCTQEEYERDANRSNDPDYDPAEDGEMECGRDNTAITVEFLA